MDKLIMAVIPRDEAEVVLDALIQAGYTATFVETKGGMLRQSQYTLFIAVKQVDLKKVCAIIKENCEVALSDESNESFAGLDASHDDLSANKIGGAIIFIWNLSSIEVY